MNVKKAAYYAIVMIIMVMALKTVWANVAPSSVDTLTQGKTERHQEASGGTTIVAEAGNVTALVIRDESVSQYWQGYYGNVSGAIVLDDVDNNTLFSWELATPSGEVFAVNGSGIVHWNNLTCVNLTTSNESRINLTTLAIQYGMNRTTTTENMSREGFNYTFNNTLGNNPIRIAQIIIGDDANEQTTCRSAYTFIDQVYQTSRFREVLLYDNLSQLVFVTLLENSISGYQTGGDDIHDFQMIVPEDGSPGQENLFTNYYFFVELE